MKILFLGMLMLICTITHAQDRRHDDRNSDRLKSQKIAFITSNLDLSVEEAEKFWPIYNKYQDKQDALRKESRDYISNAKASDETITEDEAKGIVMKGLDMEEKELELKRAFVDEVSGAISMKKIAKLKMVEREYKRSMIDKIKKRYNRSKGDRSRRP
ncbi:MAG: hypothetical protein HKN68_01690 [Saprospiraceae bacterium]|nr:hypothetical protein [Saprospiraceae bacterium]